MKIFLSILYNKINNEEPGLQLNKEMPIMSKNMMFCCCLFMMHTMIIGDPQKMVVTVSVADLRSRAEPVKPGLQGPAFSGDIGAQDSQVLFGESILAEDVPGQPDWAKVTAQTQKKWNGQVWVGYPGFMLKACLKVVSEFPRYNIVLQNLWTPLYPSMDQSIASNYLALGTRLEAQKVNPDWWQVIIDNKVCGYLKAGDGLYEFTQTITESEDELRERIVHAAHLLVSPQTPYVWGGRSPLRENLTSQITGIDCSGLSSLSYLAGGFEIPRDSGPQYRAAIPLTNGTQMEKADLMFFARPDGPQISHVMVYVGDGYMIESYGDGGTTVAEALKRGFLKEVLGTRKISVKDALGVGIETIESGTTRAKNGKRILLATYFGQKGKINALRSVALAKKLTYEQ